MPATNGPVRDSDATRSTAGWTVAEPTMVDIPVLTALTAAMVAVTVTGPAGAVNGTVPLTEAVTAAPGARVKAFQVRAAAGATSPTLGDRTRPGRLGDTRLMP